MRLPRLAKKLRLRAAFTVACVLSVLLYSGLYGDHDASATVGSALRGSLASAPALPAESSAAPRRLGEAEEQLKKDCAKKAADPGWMAAVYLAGMLYMFVAVWISCDEFFVPALEVVAEDLELSDDVAGATLMAAGGSAPELFTSMYGTFTHSAVGFGTIVGSAVFNVLFVIGACAVASPVPLKLTSWPLARDSSYYMFALSMVAVFFSVHTPQVINWWEAFVLFAMYFLYVYIMANNDDIQEWVEATVFRKYHKKAAEYSDRSANFRMGIIKLLKAKTKYKKNRGSGAAAAEMVHIGVGVITQVVGSVEEKFEQLDTDDSGFIEAPEISALLDYLCITNKDTPARDRSKAVAELLQTIDTDGDGKVSFPEFAAWYRSSEARLMVEVEDVFKHFDTDGDGSISRSELRTLIALLHGRQVAEADMDEAIRDVKAGTKLTKNSFKVEAQGADNSSSAKTEAVVRPGAAAANGAGEDFSITFPEFKKWYLASLFWDHKMEEVAKAAEEEEDDGGVDVSWPEGFSDRVWFVFLAPLVFPMYYTVPDVRKPEHRHKAVRAFFVSILWIGLYCSLMANWAETVGYTLGIPPVVMGLTVLAAGTSVPDMISSVIVALDGKGDMAVSSSIGSNIFDVLVGLPIPWLLYCMAFQEDVLVQAKALGMSILVLMIMLGCTVASIHFSGWVMSKNLGYSMFALYLVFVVQDVARQYESIGACA